MNARVAAVVIGVIAGCHGHDAAPQVQAAPAPAPTPTPAPKPGPPADAAVAAQKPSTPMNVTLEWSAKPVSGSLHVEYTLANKGDKPLYAVDDMLEWEGGKLVRAPKAIIVRNASAAGTASLFRGNLFIPTHDSRMYPSPGVRLVAPGKSVKGTAEVPLPLKAWHNYHPEKIDALKTPITQLVLEIQIVRDLGPENTDWQYETLGDGGRVQSPYLRVLNQRGEVVQGSTIAAPP